MLPSHQHDVRTHDEVKLIASRNPYLATIFRVEHFSKGDIQFVQLDVA
jgi:hypothetical protein